MKYAVKTILYLLGIALPATGTRAAQPQTQTKPQQQTQAQAQPKPQPDDAATPAKNAKPAPALKRRVAIGPFEVTAAGAAGGGERSDAAGHMSMGLLANRLKAAGGFVLIDKSNYRTLSDACDSVACNIPLLETGAEYMLIGTVTRLRYKDSLSRARQNLPPIAEAAVSLRMVDVPSGATIYSGQGRGEAAESHKPMIPERRIMGVEASLAEGAVDAALSPLADAAIARCLALPWTAYIISCDGGAYILSCGAGQGVKTGDRFAVYRYPQRGPKAPAKRIGRPVGVMEIGMTIRRRGADRDAVSVGQMVDGALDPSLMDSYYIAELK